VNSLKSVEQVSQIISAIKQKLKKKKPEVKVRDTIQPSRDDQLYGEFDFYNEVTGLKHERRN